MSIVHEAISETKRISFELTPVVLKDHGLDTAIRSLIQRLAMRSPLIEFNMPRLKRRLPEKLEYAVYRIAQELLNNCIKHSKATRVTINIRQVDEILHLEVSDNGIGFDFKKLKPMDKGIGLQSVKNRVRLLEGTQEIQSSAEGTTIRIYIPITPSP
jgi:signal transduction histidine kinase